MMHLATLLLASVALASEAPAEATIGPPKGSLVIIGGGAIGPKIVERFVELAGGPEAEYVLIPTATEGDDLDPRRLAEQFRRQFGVRKVAVLHTRDRAEADTEAFAAPLKTASAVFFGGGRQWRLVDSYLGTRVDRELKALLDRGGVIGGSSAGATIQGSYLVRGARAGPQIMMAEGYEVGLGFLRDSAIDQHLRARRRQDDLVAVIEAHPGLLGIGLDEATAIVVRGDRFEVLGAGLVGVYDGQDHEGKKYYYLSPGDAFDLRARAAAREVGATSGSRSSP